MEQKGCGDNPVKYQIHRKLQDFESFGLIIGAAISTAILEALAAVIILAVVLALLFILSVILAVCNKKDKKKQDYHC